MRKWFSFLPAPFRQTFSSFLLTRNFLYDVKRNKKIGWKGLGQNLKSEIKSFTWKKVSHLPCRKVVSFSHFLSTFVFTFNGVFPLKSSQIIYTLNTDAQTRRFPQGLRERERVTGENERERKSERWRDFKKLFCPSSSWFDPVIKRWKRKSEGERMDERNRWKRRMKNWEGWRLREKSNSEEKSDEREKSRTNITFRGTITSWGKRENKSEVEIVMKEEWRWRKMKKKKRRRNWCLEQVYSPLIFEWHEPCLLRFHPPLNLIFCLPLFSSFFLNLLHLFSLFFL